MRIGIVCPYSFDVPGGVQFHIRDLASALIARGHEVSVLAPAEPTTPVPEYVTATGGSVKVHFNGSVARLAFGPRVAARTRRWLAAGNFDVLHIHEPICPSLSLLALWAASGPIVATFHSFQERSRTLSMASTLTRAPLEKIRGAIAVSPAARGTLTDHNLGGDAVIIPNGVFVEPYARAFVNPDWVGTSDAPTLAFLGRLDEPRKGLDVLLAAIPQIRARVPGARFLVAGNGEIDAKRLVSGVEILGPVSEEDKARLLKSADLYIAPHTGGESFGIVLIEAMSAGAGVVA
ncbi:MAG: glycosyltransferase family 4 protein, partial [Micrococcales bacterium]|nr:glycosyltransferase family 4 protein [Micrococcales bacterium]